MRPGLLLQVERVRTELVDFLQRFEFEIAAESTPRHLKNVGTVCELLLEKMVRIQGHETVETRGYEEKIRLLIHAGKALWEVEPKPIAPRSERVYLRLVR